MGAIQIHRRTLAHPTPAGPIDYTKYPLKSTDYDDRDAFFTRTGTWYEINGDWPGGSWNNTVLARSSLVASETPTPMLATAVIQFYGTAEEGIALWGASEDSGPIQLQVKALDNKLGPTDWQVFSTIGSLTYQYTDYHNDGQSDPTQAASYGGGFIGQSYYDRLHNPGIVKIFGMPYGRYQFRLVKLVNTSDPGDTGNKAQYLDGATVITRVV